MGISLIPLTWLYVAVAIMALGKLVWKTDTFDNMMIYTNIMMFIIIVGLGIAYYKNRQENNLGGAVGLASGLFSAVKALS
jgi:tryptophan-rich sensory protein